MKILWHSVPPFNYTGYGVQTFHWVNILKMLGHDVKVLPNCQMYFSPVIVWSGIEILPVGYKGWGVENVQNAVFNWKPDAVITLMDSWTLPEDFGATIKANGSRWYPYVPVDQHPAPIGTMNRLVTSEMPLGMSLYAMSEIKKFGLVNAMYWPHGVSTGIYKPTPGKDVVEAGDKFVAGMVAANSGTYDRKAFQQNMEGFKMFNAVHPDSLLYLHTNPNDNGGTNQDLLEMGRQIGVEFKYSDPWALELGYTPTMLADIYNSFDVLLHCSRGEGFGVGLIEAQACGIPVITTDYTSMSELGQKGWLVPPLYEEATPQHSYLAIPNPQKIAESLSEAYDMWKLAGSDWEQKKHDAYTFAQDYAFPAITEKYVLPILEKMNEPQNPLA